MYHHGESSIEFYRKRTMTSPGLNGHRLGIEKLGLTGEAMSLTLARRDHPTTVSLGHFSHSLREQLIRSPLISAQPTDLIWSMDTGMTQLSECKGLALYL